MTSLLLKHVFQLLTHLICSQVFQILLKFWNHHSNERLHFQYVSTDRSTFLHATCNERSHHLKTLMTSLLLKHVFQLLTHLICSQVFQILLKFWNHHSKHKTCHILGIINMFFPCPTGWTRISSRCFGIGPSRT
ncbi:hypothetical protein HanIR_Chr07g0310341 [Helianthus annuus]|nr:hypothetical protein HanIR_Chr07g0310341 [Helianthus annuus]